jgi:curved DNA-binding protein
MAGEDYYDILGVKRDATDAEIKRAHRRLAKKYHPDRNKGNAASTDQFKSIQEAYEVLSDREKRAEYDRFGRAGVGRFVNDGQQKAYEWGGGSRINVKDLEELFGAFGGGANAQAGKPASIFDQVFGGNRRQRPTRHARPARPTPQKGADVQRKVAITFPQSVHGATVEINRSIPGKGTEGISVKIPKGVNYGQRIRLRGKGQPSATGGPPGDLIIICDVQPHPYFKRDDKNNIILDVPISVTEAVLGTKIDVPTLQGPVTLTIPPLTSSGAKLRIKGRGISGAEQSPGDQIVVIQIVSPNGLTDAQKKHFQELHEKLTDDPRANLGWTLDRKQAS